MPAIPLIERVNQVKLLGVLLTSNLSFTPHIDYILTVISQRFHLLNQLKKMYLDGAALSSVFTALIVSRILYALPAIYGFILQSDIDRLNAMFRKARRWRITAVEYDMDLLSTLADSGLCKKIHSENHCLNHLLLKVRDVNLHNLRDRPIRYILPRAKLGKLQNSFIFRSFKSN